MKTVAKGYNFFWKPQLYGRNAFEKECPREPIAEVQASQSCKPCSCTCENNDDLTDKGISGEKVVADNNQ